jgi:hypothetical protein
MELYRDIDGDSGVAAYENGLDYQKVEFKDGAVYLYTDRSAGRLNIQRMHELARKGDGLNEYINRHVKEKFAAKLI